MKLKSNLIIFSPIIIGFALFLSACRKPDLPEREMVQKAFYLREAMDAIGQMSQKPFQAFWYGDDTLCIIPEAPTISTYGPYYESISGDKAILQCKYKYPALTKTSWTILKQDIHYADGMDGYEAIAEADIEFETARQQATAQCGITICGEFPFLHKQDLEGQMQQCNKGAVEIMKLHPGAYYDYQFISKGMEPANKTNERKTIRFGYDKGKARWVEIQESSKTETEQIPSVLSKTNVSLESALEQKGLMEISGKNPKVYATGDVIKKITANKSQKYEIPFHFDLLKIVGEEPLKQSIALKLAEYAIPKQVGERFHYINDLLKSVKRNPSAHRSIRERIRRAVDDTLYQRLKNVKTFEEKQEIDEIIAILPWQIPRLDKLSAERDQRLADIHASELKSCIQETRDEAQLKKIYPRIGVLEKYPKHHKSVMMEFKKKERLFARPENTSRLAAMEKIVSLLAKFNPGDLSELDRLMEKYFSQESYPEIQDAYGQFLCLLSMTGKCNAAKDLCTKRNFALDMDTETIDKARDKAQLQSLLDAQHKTLVELLNFEMQRTRDALKK